MLCMSKVPGLVVYKAYSHLLPCHWKSIRYQNDLAWTSAPPQLLAGPAPIMTMLLASRGWHLDQRKWEMVQFRWGQYHQQMSSPQMTLVCSWWLKEAPKLASYSISRMGVLTTAQIWGPILCLDLCPRFEPPKFCASTGLRFHQTGSLHDAEGIGWWKTCRLRLVCWPHSETCFVPWCGEQLWLCWLPYCSLAMRPYCLAWYIKLWPICLLSWLKSASKSRMAWVYQPGSCLEIFPTSHWSPFFHWL